MMVAMARRGVATAIALNGSKSWNKIENHSLDLVGKAAEDKKFRSRLFVSEKFRRDV
jgi:hypothetical protein